MNLIITLCQESVSVGTIVVCFVKTVIKIKLENPHGTGMIIIKIKVTVGKTKCNHGILIDVVVKWVVGVEMTTGTIVVHRVVTTVDFKIRTVTITTVQTFVPEGIMVVVTAADMTTEIITMIGKINIENRTTILL